MANPLAPNPDEEDLADLLGRTSRAPPGMPINTPPPSPMPQSFGLGPSDPVGGLMPGTLTGPGVMTDLPMLDTGGSRIGLEAPEPPQPEPEEEPAPGITEEKKQPAFKYSSETQRETDKLVEMLEKNAEQSAFVYREYERKKNPIYEQILQQLKERGKVQVPPLQPLPQPPGFHNEVEHSRQGFLGFASMAGAIFLGGRSRGGLTTALNAYAGTMQGIAQNNKEAAAQEMERWKAAMDYTIKYNKQVREQYTDVLESDKMDLDTKFEAIKVIASAEGDRLGQLAAERKNIMDLGTLLKRNQETETRGLIAQLQMRRLEEVVKHAAEKGAGPKQTMSDEDLNELIDEYKATGRRPQLSVFGFRQAGDANRAAFQALLTQRIKTENWGPEWQRKAAADWSGEMAAARSGGTAAGNLDIILRSAEAAIPAAEEASKKVPRGTLRRLNDLQLAGKQEISDPLVRDFAIKNLQVGELWARAMNPRGVMRESDRTLALNNLRMDEASGTYSTALAAVKQFIIRERKAVQGFREHTPVQEETPAAPPAPTSPNRSEIPHLSADPATADAEYARLAKGQKFYDPNGQLRQKP